MTVKMTVFLQMDLQIQCKSILNDSKLFVRNQFTDSKIHIEMHAKDLEEPF